MNEERFAKLGELANTGYFTDEEGIECYRELKRMRAGLVLDRDVLRLGKYTHPYFTLTPDQMHGLLWLLGEWACRSDEEGKLYADEARAYAARKALLNFTRRPLTLEEVKALMRDGTRRS